MCKPFFFIIFKVSLIRRKGDITFSRQLWQSSMLFCYAVFLFQNTRRVQSIGGKLQVAYSKIHVKCILSCESSVNQISEYGIWYVHTYYD